MTRFVANLNQYQNKEAEWFTWQNGAGAAVPAYGIVRFSSFATVHTAVKPDGVDGLYYANGPVEQPASAYAASASWIRAQPVLFNGTGNVGDTCGPVSGQWYMDTTGTGWKVFTGPSGGVAFVVKDGGAGTTTRIIEGLVSNDNCPAGELDIGTAYATDPDNDCGQTRRIEDYHKVMGGHTAAQLVGATALAGYMYDCTAMDWVWHLWLLGGLDQCSGLPS